MVSLQLVIEVPWLLFRRWKDQHPSEVICHGFLFQLYTLEGDSPGGGRSSGYRACRHVTTSHPVLMELRLLRVLYGIWSKLALLMHMAQTGQSPSRIRDAVTVMPIIGIRLVVDTNQSEELLSKHMPLIILTQIIRPGWELNQGHSCYCCQLKRTINATETGSQVHRLLLTSSFVNLSSLLERDI